MTQATSFYPQPRDLPSPEPQQPGGAKDSAKYDRYALTEDERRILNECHEESFYQRCLPLAIASMVFCRVLLNRGILKPHPRFGSFLKMGTAGMLGHLFGKLSYVQICQKKFESLDKRSFGSAIRQESLRIFTPGMNQSEMADPNQADPADSAFESSHQSAMSYQPPADSFSYSSDYSSPSQSSYDPAPFSSSFSESAPSGVRGDDLPQGVHYLDDDLPKKKPVLYEELRSKNRENYEVTLTQKAETLLKPQAEVAVAPKKEGKKNKYGDAWEE
ncbi:OCIA domain-containing protein 1 [Sardina pilchardus]|uniref:OCIA domain-containing protein 1 n=1 Tax=Sardina pilchardus TaxID=27697 RepID=UPI002E0D92E3